MLPRLCFIIFIIIIITLFSITTNDSFRMNSLNCLTALFDLFFLIHNLSFINFSSSIRAGASWRYSSPQLLLLKPVRQGEHHFSNLLRGLCLQRVARLRIAFRVSGTRARGNAPTRRTEEISEACLADGAFYWHVECTNLKGEMIFCSICSTEHFCILNINSEYVYGITGLKTGDCFIPPLLVNPVISNQSLFVINWLFSHSFTLEIKFFRILSICTSGPT